MENTSDRVLAYNLAKVIEIEELTSVSGGMGGNWSSYMTAGGSANNGGGEAHVDAHWDF